jgi:D-alanine-D-alanine ligase
MYPKLWQATGVGYSALLDRLIGLAIERHQDRRDRQAPSEVVDG